MDLTTILAAAITAGFAFLGVYVSNRKQTTLVEFRLKKLEEKVDVHNRLVDRMYRMEARADVAETEICDLRRKLEGNPARAQR